MIKMKVKKEKGVTLIALTITIIVLLIIAGIAIYSGRETIQKANLEALRTNMLLIEAKAKGVVEEANFQLGPDFQKESEIGTIRNDLYVTENKLQKLSDSGITVSSGIPTGDNVYVFTQETASLWALDNVYSELEDGEYYIIEFNEREATVEIYNTIGYQGYYSLTDIDELE